MTAKLSRRVEAVESDLRTVLRLIDVSKVPPESLDALGVGRLLGRMDVARSQLEGVIRTLYGKA